MNIHSDKLHLKNIAPRKGRQSQTRLNINATITESRNAYL